MNVILIRWCRLQVFEFSTFSNDSLAVLIFWFCPEFGWQYMIIYFVISSFISRPISLLVPNRVSFMVFILLFILWPDKWTSSADVSHSVPNQPDILGLSWWHILRQNWKVMAIEHLPVSGHSEQEVYQTKVYLPGLCYRFHLISLTSFLGIPNSSRML
jgi:hypothetical protein